MENYYTYEDRSEMESYLAAIEGCLGLESFYNDTPNNYSISNSVPTSFENLCSQVNSSTSINFDSQTAPYGGAHANWNGPGQGLDNWASEPGPQVTERKCREKKVSGQPSKNLMAERRRRNRLNDRLSMLRSVVPKISKMDRTSILGDTIDYLKELIGKINGLQREMHLGSDELSSMSIFNDVKPNEIVVRNSPKFDVERRNADTRIEVCCGSKPGLLLCTVTTLEALGLDIRQCVISCFNEFSVQASCSEETVQRAIFDPEDVRRALLRSAGFEEVGCV